MPSDEKPCRCYEPDHNWCFNPHPGVRCRKHPVCPFRHATWNSTLKQWIFPKTKTFELGGFIKTNGIIAFRVRCVGCGTTSGEIKKKDFINLTELGVQYTHTRDNHSNADLHICQVKGCGRTDIEMQHWMPQAILGEEANLWPITPLCVDHHRQWHALVWPGPNLGKPTEILEPWHGKATSGKG
jgi:hypothetical protein